jgi:4'-phosphopantetheinyl transferase
MLARDEIPVWWLATEPLQPAEWLRWLDLLDDDERGRAGRFWLERDRRDFVAAHALLRRMLTRHLDLPSKDWRFATGPFGKPVVAPQIKLGDVDFSLAHTNGLVAAAMSMGGKIGLDTEEIDPAKADLANAETYFAPAEVELLLSVPSAERSHCFFQLWTLKEAFLKAIGTGLGTPLGSFAFSFDPIRISFASGAAFDPEDWHFAVVPVGARHILSVAMARPAASHSRPVSRALSPRDISQDRDAD